ncbi:MAG: hypothetical protein GY804_09270 [Alphaproteobacteria bacterium]|nr:hypothetical protein [Alphaproteobacteria bacterium]
MSKTPDINTRVTVLEAAMFRNEHREEYTTLTVPPIPEAVDSTEQELTQLGIKDTVLSIENIERLVAKEISTKVDKRFSSLIEQVDAHIDEKNRKVSSLIDKVYQKIEDTSKAIDKTDLSDYPKTEKIEAYLKREVATISEGMNKKLSHYLENSSQAIEELKEIVQNIANENMFNDHMDKNKEIESTDMVPVEEDTVVEISDDQTDPVLDSESSSGDLQIIEEDEDTSDSDEKHYKDMFNAIEDEIRSTEDPIRKEAIEHNYRLIRRFPELGPMLGTCMREFRREYPGTNGIKLNMDGGYFEVDGVAMEGSAVTGWDQDLFAQAQQIYIQDMGPELDPETTVVDIIDPAVHQVESKEDFDCNVEVISNAVKMIEQSISKVKVFDNLKDAINLFMKTKTVMVSMYEPIKDHRGNAAYKSAFDRFDIIMETYSRCLAKLPLALSNVNNKNNGGYDTPSELVENLKHTILNLFDYTNDLAVPIGFKQDMIRLISIQLNRFEPYLPGGALFDMEPTDEYTRLDKISKLFYKSSEMDLTAYKIADF